MARPQETPPPVFTSTAPYSPITERENEGAEEYAGRGCGCFRLFCFGGSRSSLLREKGTAGGSPWLVEKLKKLKELSEMVAGPKWKNFVRRIGKVCSSPKKHMNSTQQNAQFQYSPESYALNFSGGDNSEDHGGGEEEEEGNLLHSFSLRFASAGRPGFSYYLIN